MNGGGYGQAFLQFVNAAYMVDVRVRADELRRFQFVLFETSKDFLRVISGIDDDGFAGLLIAEDRAVAFDGTNLKRFNNHLY